MDISVSIAIIAGLLLINTCFVVAAIFKVMRVLGDFQRLMEMIRLQLAPIVHDATEIISNIRTIVKSAEKEMGKIGDSVTAVRDTTRNIKEFEMLVQERIERPLLDLTAVMAGIVKGGRVFWQSYRRRNSH